MTDLPMSSTFAQTPYSELCTQLDLAHPQGWIIVGYLERFLSLPKEVLTLLLYQRRDVILLIPRLCKRIALNFEPLWFAVASPLLIRPQEMWTALARGVTMMSKTGFCVSIAVYNLTEEGDVDAMDIEFAEIIEPESVSFEYVSDWSCDMTDFYPENYIVEPFDAHRIFSARVGCMRRDPLYANKILQAQVADMMKFEPYGAVTQMEMLSHLWLKYITRLDPEVGAMEEEEVSDMITMVEAYKKVITTRLSKFVGTV